jgi:hypothetical protein
MSSVFLIATIAFEIVRPNLLQLFSAQSASNEMYTYRSVRTAVAYFKNVLTVGDVKTVPIVVTTDGPATPLLSVALGSKVAGDQYMSSTVSPCTAQYPHPSVQPGPPNVMLAFQTGAAIAPAGLDVMVAPCGPNDCSR